VTVCASDKRIACDEEFSDSEDEGDGRRHRENFKHKRPRIDEKTDSKVTPSGIIEFCFDFDMVQVLLKYNTVQYALLSIKLNSVNSL